MGSLHLSGGGQLAGVVTRCSTTWQSAAWRSVFERGGAQRAAEQQRSVAAEQGSVADSGAAWRRGSLAGVVAMWHSGEAQPHGGGGAKQYSGPRVH